MKISENITIYSGIKPQSELNELQTEKAEGKSKKSLYVGNCNENLLQNRILQRKQEAQKKAMKVVGDAFDGDRAIDEDLQTRREHADELLSKNKELKKELQEVEKQQAELAEQYVGNEESEEYKQRQEELSDLKDYYEDTISSNDKTIHVENAVIRGTKLERLKKSPMVTAQRQAEEIKEAAGKEIIGMVTEDAKEHVDETAEEREDKAEKLEEKREEQEAFVERQKEKRKEQEELLEELPMEEMLSLNQTKTDIQKEVQDIMNKMKLVAEDIKGAAVDEAL